MWVQFARAMVPMMMPAAQAIADALDVSSAGPLRVLDIAASHGIFGIVLAQRNPRVDVVAVDWAAVLDVGARQRDEDGRRRHGTGWCPGDAFTVDYGTGSTSP